MKCIIYISYVFASLGQLFNFSTIQRYKNNLQKTNSTFLSMQQIKLIFLVMGNFSVLLIIISFKLIVSERG